LCGEPRTCRTLFPFRGFRRVSTPHSRRATLSVSTLPPVKYFSPPKLVVIEFPFFPGWCGPRPPLNRSVTARCLFSNFPFACSGPFPFLSVLILTDIFCFRALSPRMGLFFAPHSLQPPKKWTQALGFFSLSFANPAAFASLVPLFYPR